jgi:hypothetical protein
MFVFKLTIMVNYCLASYYLPGGIDLAKKFVSENGNTEEHDEFYRMIGISQENIWIQKSPPGSGLPDMQLVSIETNDPANVLKGLATSDHSWALKFRKYAKEAFGIDFSDPPPPPNKNIVTWKENN